jgi:hypothetical protein
LQKAGGGGSQSAGHVSKVSPFWHLPSPQTGKSFAAPVLVEAAIKNEKRKNSRKKNLILNIIFPINDKSVQIRRNFQSEITVKVTGLMNRNFYALTLWST